jgi:hypothetical protein
MQSARARLLIASALLAGWVAWLGYKALSRGRDYPVLSHSQLLVSALDVIADVKSAADGSADPVVVVREVHWPSASAGLAGTSITVTNLPSSLGFQGTGEYILPLVRGEGPGEYRVAGLPRSPGFDSFASPHFIYPVLPITRQQLEAIPKPSG